eukprot:COSAG06_NODE_66113_length_255_cov_0.660256_1_plen_35_part_10
MAGKGRGAKALFSVASTLETGRGAGRGTAAGGSAC